MSRKTYDALTLFNKYKTPDRDMIIQEMIAEYFKRNAVVLSDGILYNIPVLSSKERARMSAIYKIPPNEFNQLRKNKEFKVFKRDETITELKIGLILSYVKTGKPIFLNYFSILVYSSLYFKYYPNGCNVSVLKYTIEQQDNRTDFKRYNMSLMTVVIKKTEVMIEHIRKSRFVEPDGTISDYGVRMILQAIMTRLNNMMRTLCSKYMENMKDDNVKIMMQYSKTLDGKNVISPINVIETVRDVANENLRMLSFKALNMSALTTPGAIKYKSYISSNYNEDYDDYVEISNLIINEWLKRHPNPNLSEFKKNFVKDMKIARNINHIYDRIQVLYKKHLTPELDKTLSKETFRKYLFDYSISNILLATLDVVKNNTK